MRILFVNHFPLTGSGSGVYTLNLMKSLQKRGHECAVVFPENRKNYEKFTGIKEYPVFFKGDEKIEGQLNFNFPCFSTHPRSDYNFINMTKREKNDYQEAFYRAIWNAIYDFEPDIMHGQHIWVLSGICSTLGEIYDIPLVVTCHGTDIIGMNNEEEKGISWGRVWAEQAYDYASKIICISDDNLKLLNKEFGKSDKTTIIRNGINTDIFYKDDTIKRKDVLKEYGIDDNYDNVISYVGKLTEIKGVDTLLDALSINDDPNLLTLIVGDGELREELEAKTRELNLKNVHFLGNLPQEELNKIYNIVDCSIVPSRKEAFGLVAAEALACGSPVIASNIGGLTSIVTDDVGMIFDVNNSKELAKDIKDITSKKVVFDRKRISKEIINKYSQDSIIKEVEDIYNEALNQKVLYK